MSAFRYPCYSGIFALVSFILGVFAIHRDYWVYVVSFSYRRIKYFYRSYVSGDCSTEIDPLRWLCKILMFFPAFWYFIIFASDEILLVLLKPSMMVWCFLESFNYSFHFFLFTFSFSNFSVIGGGPFLG